MVAVLELIRLKQILVTQSDVFGDIDITQAPVGHGAMRSTEEHDVMEAAANAGPVPAPI